MIWSVGRCLALGLSALFACGVVLAQSQESQPATTVPLDSPKVTRMVVDADGTLHFDARTVPMPVLNSPAARKAYTQLMLERARASAARGGLASARTTEIVETGAPDKAREASLKRYPVLVEDSKIGGVNVTIFSPRLIPRKNRHKVALEFEMEAEAIAVANLAQMKVI
ncbi:MAG: hypothetical protein JOY77_06045, partial [Alphaproteobacteria bacterium]|nr:hypothetical protein [Alphaproteobacteria bacterium]